MSLTNSQYNAIMREYEENRINNKYVQDEHLSEVYDLIPEYKDLDTEITELAISAGKKRILGDKDALVGLSEKINEISEQKKKLLLEYSFPENYLEPIYTCPDCQDTGYIDENKCHCLKHKILRCLYAQSNIEEVLERENFETLTYDYYNDDEISDMKVIVSRCKDFVCNFDNEYKNILLLGNSGVGKTFLTNCIAKALLDSGHSVIYFTSFQLFDTLAQYAFSYDNDEEVTGMCEDIFGCDLLIIDDLGTENANSFVASSLFRVVNERDIRRKSTIISTNLSLGQLNERYAERSMSRIFGQYDVIKPDIQDIRLKMKDVLK